EVRRRLRLFFGSRILPVGSCRGPLRPQPAFVGVGILDDQTADPARVPRGEVKSGGRAKVVKIKMEGSDSEPRERFGDHVRKARKRRGSHRLGGSEAGKVRR